MLTLQCMYANLLKRHGLCWVLHAKWYPSVRIDSLPSDDDTTSSDSETEHDDLISDEDRDDVREISGDRVALFDVKCHRMGRVIM